MTAPVSRHDAPLPKLHRVRATAERVRHAPVLDVGAGQCLLEPLLGDGLYVATDLSASVLRPGPNRLTAEVLTLPFKDGTFGTVTCISVLQYVLDVAAALDELRRVLRPGGQLLVLVPNVAYLRNRLVLGAGRFPWSSKLDSWHEGTIRYFTLHDFEPLVVEHGFRVREVACSGRLRGLRSSRPGLLGADLLLDLERA